MSDQVVVRCPACSQKYRVAPSAIGTHAHCRKCRTRFRIAIQSQIDDDTVFAWITDDDPSSSSVMGSTGIFAGETGNDVVTARNGSRHDTPTVRIAGAGLSGVKLIQTDAEGVHFEFPISMLHSEQLRSSFPRKCVGCGTRQRLDVHLIYWPQRMSPHDAANWRAREEASAGRLEAFHYPNDSRLLAELPSPRGMSPPFNLPFPFFACPACRASRQVRGEIVAKGNHEVCQLTIGSLAVAVSFFRENGGRNAPEYQRLIELRDHRPDAWQGLDAQVRQRLALWFEAQADERFVGFFGDTDTSPQESGESGVVLTDKRLIYRKNAVCHASPLGGQGRIELTPRGSATAVHIYEQGKRPALLMLDPASAGELAGSLRRLPCKWTVTG